MGGWVGGGRMVVMETKGWQLKWVRVPKQSLSMKIVGDGYFFIFILMAWSL